MKCINCETETEGKYCSQCGQKLNIKRITLKEGWNDFWARVYGFDGMFPRTFRDLTLRPGVAAQLFISGNRTLYYGPVGYFFLMITLFVLLLSMLNIDYYESIRDVQKMMPVQQENPAGVEKFTRILLDNIKIFAFMAIPFQAIAAKYFLFRKSNYNFLEHTVLPFYISGHIYWVIFLSLVLYKFVGTMNQVLTTVLTIVYFGYAYTTLMTYQSKIKSFLKGIMVYVLAQVLFVLAIMLLAIVVALFYAWLDPDSLKEFVKS